MNVEAQPSHRPSQGQQKQRLRRRFPKVVAAGVVSGLLLALPLQLEVLAISLSPTPKQPGPGLTGVNQSRRQFLSSWHSLARRDCQHQPHQRLYASNDSHPPPFIQVISDVDDTLKSSGGVNIAGVALGGIDVQYPRGAYYPGVAEFMLHVSLGPHFYDASTTSSPTMIPAKVAVLTARAEEFKFALELKADNPLSIAFAKAGQAVGVADWGLGPVLYGSVAEWIVQDRKGLRKFNNFERLIQQDPTNGALLQYVYVGDTGELDQQAGETMLREYPHLVQAVFLHVVSGTVNDTVIIPPIKLINGRPVIFFRTYVGAAVAAVQLGLMCEKSLERIIQAAMVALRDEDKSSDKWMDLERDIIQADKLLGKV
jgi:hypothetical protein